MPKATELKLYYCSFGCGQTHANHVQPIRAASMADARAEMFRRYGREWCSTYTAAEWEEWTHEADKIGVPLETELPVIIVWPDNGGGV